MATTTSGSLVAFTETDGVQYFSHRYGRCVRLTTTNFLKWDDEVTGLLITADQFGIVTGTEAEPEAPSIGDKFSTVDKHKYELWKNYQERKREAVSILYHSLSNHVQPRFIAYFRDQERNPHEFWKAIRSQMNIGQNHLSSATLRRQFNKMEWNSDETLQSWISRIGEYRNQLKGTDHAISDADLVMTLLMGLPTEWSTTRENIFNLPKEQQTWDYTVLTLQSKELLIKASKLTPATGTALTARSRGGHRGWGG